MNPIWGALHFRGNEVGANCHKSKRPWNCASVLEERAGDFVGIQIVDFWSQLIFLLETKYSAILLLFFIYEDFQQFPNLVLLKYFKSLAVA